MGLRSILGLGLDQPIPPAALRDAPAPPEGLEPPQPHLRPQFLLYAGLLIVVATYLFINPQLIGHDGTGAVLPLWPGAGISWVSVIGWCVGIGLILLVWAQWNAQKQAIAHGVQTVATVFNYNWTFADPHTRVNKNLIPILTLYAQWIGNDETTYHFATIPRRYSSSSQSLQTDWIGKQVRLYIDRDDTRLYFLDDVPLPYQEIPGQMPAASPATPMTVQTSGYVMGSMNNSSSYPGGSGFSNSRVWKFLMRHSFLVPIFLFIIAYLMCWAISVFART